MAELSYCAAQVRRMDPDRFATALFAPEGRRREALMALYAFNTEIARVRETVSEPMVGEMRLQWWRDALDGIAAGSPRRHGVVEPLADAIAAFALPRGLFDELIDARESDLVDEPPETLDDLARYADATSGALQALALRIVVPDGEAAEATEAAETAARHVGIAFSLAGIARAVPFHASLGKVHLPRAVCREAGLASAAHDRLRQGAEVSAAARILCARATDHLRKARHLRAEVAKAALPALLPAVAADTHLRRMAASGYDPFDARVSRPAGAHLRLAWAAFRGRY